MATFFYDSNGNAWQATATTNGDLQLTKVVVTAPPSTTVPVVQDVINRVVQDSDRTIGFSHASLIDYINRVHTQLLRLTSWKFLLSPIQSFTTVAGSTDYWFGLTGTGPAGTVDTLLNISDLQRIDPTSVQDTTNFTPLFRTNTIPMGPSSTQPQTLKLYRNDSSTPYVMNLYPVPQATYTINFRYYVPRAFLVNATDQLQIPIQYLDVVVAGVNELVAKLQKRDDDAVYWHEAFGQGKRDMLKDSHPFGPDYISPDPTSVSGGYVNSMDSPLFKDSF